MSIERSGAPGQRTGGTQEEDFTGSQFTSTGVGLARANRETIERLISVEDQIEQAGRRILQDVFTESLATSWERRGQVFDDARRKPGDYQPPHLQVSEEERAQRDHDLAATALACRRKAEFIRAYGDPEAAHMVALAILEPLSAQNRESGEVAA